MQSIVIQDPGKNLVTYNPPTIQALAYSLLNARPITILRISEVPAPIS